MCEETTMDPQQADTRTLHRLLMAEQFRFLSPGEHHLKAIYAAVKSRHGGLCDDTFRCDSICTQGHNQPEWCHTVRRVLDQSKNNDTGLVQRGKGLGYWLLGAPGANTANGGNGSASDANTPEVTDLESQAPERVLTMTYQ